MVIGGEQLQAEKVAVKAIELLKRYNRAPTPDNYALFYYYASGQNPKLKAAMDVLFTQQPTLNQQQCDDLFRIHLGLEAEHRLLVEANAAIEAEIAHMMEVIDTSQTGTDHYSQSLDTFSGNLAESSSLDHIRDAVSKVFDETRAMAAQNERLQEQLAQATLQLTETRNNLDIVHKESQIDPLTEVGNRKFLDQELVRVVTEAREAESPLALLMVDIDHFKKFNDTYGHQIGDQVLRLVARTLVENLKGRDVIARYGGEEFCILLPETNVADAEKVGNALRAHLGNKQLKRRNSAETLGTVMVSVGAAELAAGEDIENFIARADAALYEAKQSGRNRVVCAAPAKNRDLDKASDHKKLA